MAHELVARNGLRVSGSTFLGDVQLDQSLSSTILALDPSNNEVNFLSLASFSGDTFISGGTLSGIGDSTLVLTNNQGGTISIADVNIHVTGGTLNGSTGAMTFTNNQGVDFNVEVAAVTGLTYNNDWDVALAGYGTLGTSPIELPFITGATLNGGSLTLEINQGLESDIVVSGFGTLTGDTFATGGTLSSSVLTIDLNNGTDFDVTGFQFNLTGDQGIGQTVQLGLATPLQIIGGQGITTVGSATNIITINTDQPYVSGGSITNNVITLNTSNGTTTLGTVDALTAVTYSSAWDVAFAGTGTLGTTGSLTLAINDGLESDIVVSGFGTLTGDTFVTGATVDYPEATLTRNDGNTVLIDSEQTIRVTSSGAGTQVLFNVDPLVYGAVHVEYFLSEKGGGTGYRSGFFTAVFGRDAENTPSVEFADWSTVDLGTSLGVVELDATANGEIRVVAGATQSMDCTANTRAVKI
jgi:hypothetical protein